MTAAKLKELEAKASKGPFESHGCYIDGKNMRIYDEGGHDENDAALIAYLLNHCKDFIRLMEAAEQEHGGSHHEPECPICVALAAFKEKS
jgi:hypothetical protein